MSNTSLAATLFGPRDVRLVETKLPPLEEGMVRIKFRAGGICGSDIHYFRHARSGDVVAIDPLILGHEIAGQIVQIDGNIPSLDLGDRVAVNPARPCRTCAACLKGRANLCEDVLFMGSAARRPHVNGGFSSYFDVLPSQCFKIPDHVPFAAASLAEPLAVALHAVNRAGKLDDGRALIMGGGPIGLLILLALKQAGLKSVSVADIAPAPLEFAKQLGAGQVFDVSDVSTAALMGKFDVIFEAAGSAAALNMSVALVGRGGTIVQVGNLSSGPISFSANAIMAKEVDLKGSYRFGDEFKFAVELISKGAIDVERIITARLPLTDAPDAFLLAIDRERSVKVVLTAE